MRAFRSTFFVLAAFLWLPVSAHCRLETVPGFEFLACLTEGTCHDNKSSDRGDSGCCAVEKSQYKTQQPRLTLRSPELLPTSFAPIGDAANTLPAEGSVGILTAAPPELRTTWQFVSRTALPVRAPSIAS
jgi:hypothetical protein